ncbi:beta-ketoacyl synthase, N-terminal domain protein [Mycobacterium kansasii]|uniref:Beta-ketoacyl synthase, N-terminal domain protein n=1 Tax=Mycobacterium kansasii TaxID=1768 RepID=A0A1V3XR27_MYCKA|nr:beta-ketoacyl synthase, N-terminal domain protein [Mycobacterium kansasii]
MSRIAIVGIGCRYAGGIDSPQSFWDFVVNKNDGAIGDIPADRWDYRRFYDSDKGAAGKMYTKRVLFWTAIRGSSTRSFSVYRRARPRAWIPSSA